MPAAIPILVVIKNLFDMKNLLIFTTLLVLTQIAALAVDLGSTTSQTPYDRYMSPVKQTFAGIRGEGATMQKVQALMRQGRGFRYAHSEPYYPAMPEETAAKRKGDCKDKALWLINQLQDPSARFVIGKEKRGAKISHAWVMWENEGQWWILDCTMTSKPVPADRVSDDKYVPLYSWAKGASFRHSEKAGLADVAGKKAPVASQADRRIASN